MSLAHRVADLMRALAYDDIQSMRPSDRRQFADMCRHIADLADRPTPPKAGVLCELNTIRREA